MNILASGVSTVVTLLVILTFKSHPEEINDEKVKESLAQELEKLDKEDDSASEDQDGN